MTGPDGTVYPATEVVRQARARLGWEWSLNDADVAFIQRLMDWSLELGYIKKRLTTGELIDRSFADKAAGGVAGTGPSWERAMREPGGAP